MGDNFYAFTFKLKVLFNTLCKNQKAMKTKTGIISGFVLGVAGFLFMFKIIVLDHVPPSDELAPGIVVMAAVLNGVLFAFIGHSIQHSLAKKN